MLDCIGVFERHISVNRWYRWSVVYFIDVAVVFLLRDYKLNVVVTDKKEKIVLYILVFALFIE